MTQKNGFKETEIGSIPNNWEVIKLGECIDTKKGRKPETLTNSLGDGFEPYLTADYFRTGNTKQFVDVEKEKNSIIVDKEDIVLIWDGSNAGDVFTGLRGILASTMVKIIPKNNLTRQHLFYFLKTKFDILNEKTTGSTIPHVSKSVFEGLPFVLPPLIEQQKIASVLSKIQQVIEHQNKIIEKTKELKRSLMQRLFTYGLRGEELKETEIGLMPESWEVKPFEALCENVKDSWNPGQNMNGIYVGLEHIETENSILKSFGTAQNLRSSKFIFSEGDILYGKLRPYLDKAVITNKKGICSTDILVFRPKNNVPAGFIVNLIHWSPFIEYTKKTTHGVNHPRTSWNSIRIFTCGIPQYEEQKEIASILSSIDEKIERERQREYQFRALFKSMLQLLMTGQVRVKDIDFGKEYE